MKYAPLILFVVLFSCQKQPKSSSSGEKSVMVFVQSDSVLMGEKIMRDGSIRKDNFHLDIDASPTELPSLYRAYDVEKLNICDNIYLIKTKKPYARARTFFRLIQFNNVGRQIAARTFVDYQFKRLVVLKKGYRLEMRKPSSGPDWAKLGPTFQELVLDTHFNTKVDTAALVFVQSDSVLMGEKIMDGDSIRKDNFHLDENASPAELPSLYRAYDVIDVDEKNNVYLIKTKRVYAKARTFFRLIRFNKLGKQMAARTFVDYQYMGLIKLKDGYCLGLKKPISGVDWGEKDLPYQVLFLDKNFNTQVQKLSCASSRDEMLGLSLKNDTVKLNVRVYMGCTMCDDEMWYYAAKFSPTGAYWGGEILRHSVYPQADSMLFEEVKACLGE